MAQCTERTAPTITLRSQCGAAYTSVPVGQAHSAAADLAGRKVAGKGLGNETMPFYAGCGRDPNPTSPRQQSATKEEPTHHELPWPVHIARNHAHLVSGSAAMSELAARTARATPLIAFPFPHVAAPNIVAPGTYPIDGCSIIVGRCPKRPPLAHAHPLPTVVIRRRSATSELAAETATVHSAASHCPSRPPAGAVPGNLRHDILPWAKRSRPPTDRVIRSLCQPAVAAEETAPFTTPFLSHCPGLLCGCAAGAVPGTPTCYYVIAR